MKKKMNENSVLIIIASTCQTLGICIRELVNLQKCPIPILCFSHFFLSDQFCKTVFAVRLDIDIYLMKYCAGVHADMSVFQQIEYSNIKNDFKTFKNDKPKVKLSLETGQ
jgi:hypothetical protein